jgi:hypothetical protein
LILSLHGSAPKNTTTPQSKTPSAHTYRLLVFKEHSPKPQHPLPPDPAAFASLLLQHRNEIMSRASRFVNRFFYSTPTFRFAAKPVLLGSAASSIAPRCTHFLTSLRLIEKRRNGILVPVSASRKGFAKRISAITSPALAMRAKPASQGSGALMVQADS